MPKPQNSLDVPALRDYLATLPEDGELARLADAFAATVEPLAAVRQRPGAIAARIAAIDQLLIDASAQEAAALLGERATLAAELLSLPVKAAALAARYASAELGYLRRARGLIHAEGTAAATGLGPLERAAVAINNRSIRMESSGRSGDEKFAALAALRQEHVDVAVAARPLSARVAAAEAALGLIDALARQKYGDRVAVLQEGAHPTLAAAYGQRVAFALSAA